MVFHIGWWNRLQEPEDVLETSQETVVDWGAAGDLSFFVQQTTLLCRRNKLHYHE
jgi:hypothetical protein